MSIRRTLWICPKCDELKPTRHESVIRHIVRKHNSLGEPISVTTRQTRNQMIATGSLAPIKRSPGGTLSRECYSNSFDAVITDRKIEQGKAQTGFSDVRETFIRLRQVQLTNETNENVKEIIKQNLAIIASLADLKEMYEPKRSRRNFTGEFA
jgi:hypothetical protein